MRTQAAGRVESGEALLRQMAARRRRDNIVVAVLAVLAVIGGGHAVYDVVTPEPPPPGDEAMVAVDSHARLASSFAEDFVVTYLRSGAGQQDRLARFVDNTQQLTLPKRGRPAGDSRIVYTTRVLGAGGVEVWSVTVSVVLDEKDPDAVRQYYRVPISLSQGTLRALTLPAVVEPPGPGDDLANEYAAPCGEETEFHRVATGFLTAYLTGSGDVTRYASIDSGIAALTPPPFTKVDRVTVQAPDSTCGSLGNEVRILATAVPADAAGATGSLAYPLTMVRGTGQWTVRAIDALPALRQPLTIVVPQGGPQAPATGTATATTTGAPTTAAEIPPATQN